MEHGAWNMGQHLQLAFPILLKPPPWIKIQTGSGFDLMIAGRKTLRNRQSSEEVAGIVSASEAKHDGPNYTRRCVNICNEGFARRLWRLGIVEMRMNIPYQRFVKTHSPTGPEDSEIFVLRLEVRRIGSHAIG